MNQWIILLINLLIMSVPSQQTHPSYSYVCKEDGSIDFLGIKDPGYVSVVRILYSTPNTSAVVNCTNIIHVTGGKAIIPKSCFNNAIISKGNGRTVSILVYDPALPVTATPVSTYNKTNKTINGGIQSNQYSLKCNGVPKEGVRKTVIGRFKAKLEEVIPTQNIETSSIQMTFRGTAVATDPSISSLYTGDSFYMFLQYSGKQQYTLDPSTCTAFGGNSVDNTGSNTIKLWEEKTSGSCVPDDALAYKIAESAGFLYVTSTEVKIHLFAFHFTNSDYITIECKVNLKPYTTVTEDLKVCKDNLRRRRDSPVNRNNHQYTVHSTLKVRNKLSPNKGNSIMQSWTIMSSVILSGVMVMKGV